MKKLITVITLFSSYLLLAPCFASAAAYIKLGDIKGEAMEVQSVRWMAPESLKNKQSSRAVKAGVKSQSGNISIIKELDKSSPKLQEMLNSGGSFGEITITEGNKNFLLKNVKVVSIEKKGKQEVVSMRFSYKQEFGPTRGADHNTTRSNRASSTKATDYNSSRSNRTTQ